MSSSKAIKLGLLIAVTSFAAIISAFQTPQRSRSSVTAAARRTNHIISPILDNNNSNGDDDVNNNNRQQKLLTIMNMASNGGGDGTKRRRRKRKKKTTTDSSSSTPSSTASAAAATPPKTESSPVPPPSESTTTSEQKQSAKALAAQLLAQEQMMYDEDDLTSFTPQKLEEDDRITAAASKAGFSLVEEQVQQDQDGGTQLEDLFDSREFLQRKREKQLEDQSKLGKPSSVIPTKQKIKRSDVKAYTRLLEMDPLADEDSSYFEDENDGNISVIQALLGDVEPGVGNDTDEVSNKSGNRVQKKTSFLGIGSGPLQVGHFIGALGVVLMAFVEYPGFPLTNLPSPLRGALQGGLATIYGVNLVMAVIAAFSAPGRNQPALLWGAKTFAVGGIAYDQLMQIPTPAELEERARREREMGKLRGRGSRRSRQ